MKTPQEIATVVSIKLNYGGSASARIEWAVAAAIQADRDEHAAREKETGALIALIADRLAEAGGTLDSKLQHQIIMDLQSDIRQGGDIAAAWWLEQFQQLRAQVKELRDALEPFAEAERRWMAGSPAQEIRMDWLTREREVLARTGSVPSEQIAEESA